VVPCMVSKIDCFCNNKSLREGWRAVLGRGPAPKWHLDTRSPVKGVLNLRKLFCGGCQVRYEALMRTYSAVKSQVQKRVDSRPAWRSMMT